MTPDCSLLYNEWLLGLSLDELDQLRSHLHPVTFVVRQVSREVDGPIEDVSFLESGLVTVTSARDFGFVEVGITSREGFVSTSVPLNAKASLIHRARIQSGTRIPATGLRRLSVAARQ